jgi:hypothetical protein
MKLKNRSQKAAILRAGADIMNHGRLAKILGITATVALAQGATLAIADQVILDDLIVDGSICAGMDCVNGESFGFDTIRVKENNLRIRAVDTSSTASFPSRDWQITFNDSSNGGADKFSIDDIDGGRTPFTIEAGAPSHSLYVDDGGRLGLGTNTPVTDIHIKSGNTPTLRLEQDGSSGFTPQTWDLAGNEANFFIRDATNGSTLPFRIFPSAPSSALTIEGTTGDIGMGTTTPDAHLDVEATANTKISLTNTGAARWSLVNSATQFRVSLADSGVVEFLIENGGDAQFAKKVRLAHADSGNTWAYSNQGNSMRTSLQGSGVVEWEVLNNGNAILAGALTQNSDINAKQDIESVDQQLLLAKVMELPISEWSYIDDPSSRHVGPMAQDFHRAFGLGNTDKGIATIDTGGVALAAIQGVKKENDRQIEFLNAENRSLKAEVQQLRELVEQLIKAEG